MTTIYSFTYLITEIYYDFDFLVLQISHLTKIKWVQVTSSGNMKMLEYFMLMTNALCFFIFSFC